MRRTQFFFTTISYHPLSCFTFKLSKVGDIGQPFRMTLALWVVRIQYRDSVRRLVFSPYNKFCNPLQLRNFLSGNFLEPGYAESHPRFCAILDQYSSTRPSSFNRENAFSTYSRPDSSLSRIIQLLQFTFLSFSFE